MHYANPTRGHKPFAFNRDRLPNPAKYYFERIETVKRAAEIAIERSEAEVLVHLKEHGA